MSEVTVRLDKPDGTTEEATIDIDLDSLTMRESVRLEAFLGADVFTSLARDGLNVEDVASPKIIQGVIWVKLKTLHPELDADAFDIDLDDLARAFGIPDPKAPTSDGSSG